MNDVRAAGGPLLPLSIVTSGLLLMFVLVPEPGVSAYVDMRTTAVAFLALVVAVLVCDRALARRTTPIQASAAMALPFGFFVRQVGIADSMGNRALAVGGERVLLFAFVLSVICFGVRWYRRGRSNRPR